MKRILYIAPHCYPIRSSESICNSKVAYSLAKAGFKVDVYTCADKSTYPIDREINTLLKDSDNLTITTATGNVMTRNTNKITLVKLLFRYLIIYLKTGYYYNGIEYSYNIVRSIKKKIKKQGGVNYDVMITRGFYTEYVGIYIAKRYNIKWIANWNDPYPLEKFPEPYGKGYGAKLSIFSKKVVNNIEKYANIYTYPCERLRDYMFNCFMNITKEQTLVIHHMAHSCIYYSGVTKSQNRLRLVHSGSVSRPRNPEKFLQALSIAIKQIGSNIECVFLGGYDSNIKQLVDIYDLNDNITFLPSMSYSESLKYLSSANISLIIEAICEEGIYLPTKFVDAIQCHTPVLCVSPQHGTLHDYVDRYNVGYFCDNENVENIAFTIARIFRDFKQNKLPVVDLKQVESFFNEYIIKQYKEII